MDLRRDENAEDFSAPVVSVSRGDEALFRLEGKVRKSPTKSVNLFSGRAMGPCFRRDAGPLEPTPKQKTPGRGQAFLN